MAGRASPGGEDRDRFNQLPAQTLQRADAGHGRFLQDVRPHREALARPFQWKEFTGFSWFLMTVSLLPTFAMSIPLTVLIIFIFNLLLTEFGAADVSGARARRPR